MGPGLTGEPRALRVLHVLPRLSGGGAERSTILQLRQLAELKDQVHAVLTFSAGTTVDVPVPVVAPAADITGRLGQARWVRAAIRRHRPDLLHPLTFDADLAARLAAVGTPTATLISIINAQYGSGPIEAGIDPRKLRLVRAIDGLLARHATDYVHAITNAVAQDAVDHLGVGADDIAVVPRGRSIDALGGPCRQDRRHATRAALGIERDRSVVLSIGREDRQKGQVLLLEALTRLPVDGGPLLLIAGRAGNASADLDRRTAELGVGDRVRRLGARDDVGDLLCAADVFAFPSLWEGLGGAVLEAMAMGTPIVAADLPALREVLDEGRCGSLVPPNDADALAAAIAAALADGRRTRARVEAASGRFRRRYTLEASGDAMAALYRSIAVDMGIA